MATPLINKLRGVRPETGIPPAEVRRQIALSLSIAQREARRAQDNAIAAAVTEVVEALGIDVAEEVSANV